MTARERILALKLLEKQAQHPEYTRQIGVQVNLISLGAKPEPDDPIHPTQ